MDADLVQRAMKMHLRLGKSARRWLPAALVLWSAPLHHGRAQVGASEVISGISVSNSHPSVDASNTGDRVAVVWDGLLNGARRIFLRERLYDQWLPEVVIDNAPLADNSNPAVDIDQAGTVHVAWLARVDGKLRVFYAFRTMSGESFFWGLVNPDEDPDNSCDAVYLRADQQGRPWIAWQSGNGSDYAVRTAYLGSGEGLFVVHTFRTAANAYNLFPQVFFQPDPVIVWYSASTADFLLVGQRFDYETGEWTAFSPANLDRMPRNKLPLLMDHADGTISGLWLAEVDFVERVHLGRQGEETAGVGVVIDSRENALNEQLSGMASNQEVLATWCSDDGTSGPQVYLASGTDIPFDEELVSDGAKRLYANPRVTAVPGGAVVVWESAPLNGDPGRIWFRAI